MKILTISYPLAEGIIKSWWVVIFIIICSCIYDKASKKQLIEMEKLEKKVNYFNDEIKKNYEKQKQLKLHIEYQQNSELIELILMRKLGVVPKGYTKIRLPDKINSQKNSEYD